MINIPRVPAIYKIANKFDGKGYIGSAVNAFKRWQEHLHHLRKNKHHSILLQRAWNKYGEEAFEFVILELVDDKEKLLNREQYYLDLNQSYNPNKGYNICPTAGSNLGRKFDEDFCKEQSLLHIGFKHTEESKRKISEAGKRPCAPETKEKIRNAQKGKPRPYVTKKLTGRKHTSETKQKMSLAKLGKPSPNKGKIFSEEWRHNLSMAQKKRRSNGEFNG